MAEASTGLLGVPYQLLVDAVLPLLNLSDLMALRATAPGLRAAIDDDVVWRRRIARDFRFPLSNSARTSGWKTLYRGLSDPELFTWGDYRDDRLGIRPDRLPNESVPATIARLGAHLWSFLTRVRCIPFPIRIAWRGAEWYDGSAHIVDGRLAQHERPAPFDGNVNLYAQRRIMPNGRRKNEHNVDAGVPVELHAGGWSFFALTHLGQVLAIGKGAEECDAAETETTFVRPTLLDLAKRKAKQLSVGRAHAVALMDDGVLLEWARRWDRHAVHYQTSLMAGTRLDGKAMTRIRQLEAGWDFTAILVDDTSVLQGKKVDDEGQSTANLPNEVLIWKSEWTYGDLRKQWFQTSQNVTDPHTVIDASWQVDIPTVMLPTLDYRIKRIAAGDRFVLALTEDGVVYYLELPEVAAATHNNQSTTSRQQAEGLRQSLLRNFVQWKRLPQFCDTLYESGWNADRSENVWDRQELRHLLDEPAKITHISAQFKSFAVYAPDAGKALQQGDANGAKRGSGVVILGNKDKLEEPVVMPQLQGINVIKVVHGDWHAGALTLDGRVLTWGSQSLGALGTWDALTIPENAESLLSSSQTASVANVHMGAGHARPYQASGIFRRLIRMRQQDGEEEAAALAAQQARDDAERDHEDGTPRTSIAGAASKESMVLAEQQRYRLRRLPDKVSAPQQVRFGFPLLGERRNGRAVEADDEQETKYVFDIAFAGWHSGALAVDRRLLSDSV